MYLIGENFVGQSFRKGKFSSRAKNFGTFPARKFSLAFTENTIFCIDYTSYNGFSKLLFYSLSESVLATDSSPDKFISSSFTLTFVSRHFVTT